MFLVIMIESSAQYPVGLKLGVNLSKIHSTNPYRDYNFALFYQFGLTSQINLYKDRFFLQPELLYSRRGSNQITLTGEKRRFELKNFDSAIILKYGAFEDWFFDIGTILSMGNSGNYLTDKNLIWRSYFGISRKVNEELLIELSYNYSLTKLTDHYEWGGPKGSYFRTKERDSTIQFSFRYLFMETIK